MSFDTNSPVYYLTITHNRRVAEMYCSYSEFVTLHNFYKRAGFICQSASKWRKEVQINYFCKQFDIYLEAKLTADKDATEMLYRFISMENGWGVRK